MKRLKIFKAGNYPQGEFSVDKLKDIVSNTKDAIKAQFAHTSKLKKEPVVVGEFTNVTLEGDEVFADFNFNDEGAEFYNKGIIEGLSVEIKENAFDRVAALPIGVNPAVQGAEFSEQHGYYVALEFESKIEGEEFQEMNIEKMPLEEKLDMIKSLAKSIGSEHKETFRAIAYEFELVEKPKEVIPKTEAEIREEISKEFELKAEKEKFVSLAKENCKPAFLQIVEFAAEALFTNENVSSVIEFEDAEGNKAEKSRVEEFENIIKSQKIESPLNGMEFEKKEKKDKKEPESLEDWAQFGKE